MYNTLPRIVTSKAIIGWFDMIDWKTKRKRKEYYKNIKIEFN